MTTAVFDTLKASDTLKAAGIEAKQAGAVEDTVPTNLDKLEASVKADIKLLKWMIDVVLACVAFPILKSLLL